MTTIKFRRDTSTNWTQANPIPAQGEPCYETDTGKLKIGNGSDYYSNLPYVSDGGTAGGTTDYTELENKPQINSVELSGNKTLDDLGIQAKGDYLKTAQVGTNNSASASVGVYLNSNSNKLDTIQPKFNSLGDALDTATIAFLKNATYSASEPDNDDMTNNWTNVNGILTDSVDSTGYISGFAKFGAGSGSLQVIFKLMESAIIKGVDQAGSSQFSKFEISSNGTDYTEVASFDSSTYVKYIRFTFDYSFTSFTYADFRTRIRTLNINNITAGTTKSLGVQTDGTTIKVVNNKLVGNITSDMVDATYMKINDSGKLSVDTAAIAHLAMPSTTTVSLTLGASGTTYTAPADGYVSFKCSVTEQVKQYQAGVYTEYGGSVQCGFYGYSSWGGCIIPISKGQWFTVSYEENTSDHSLQFVYLQGNIPSS